MTISLFLAFQQVPGLVNGDGSIPGCSGQEGSCGNVLNSSYGKVFGLPVSIWSIGYLAVSGGLLLRSIKRGSLSSVLALTAWSSLGWVGGVWFIWVMKSILGKWCLWCLTVHVANLLFFFLAVHQSIAGWNEFRLNAKPEQIRKIRFRLVLNIIFAIVLVGGQVYLYRLGTDFQMNVKRMDGLQDPLQVAGIKVDEIPTRKGSLSVDPNLSGKKLIRIALFTCPNCEACAQTNQILNRFRKKNPEIVVDVRFFPLSTVCNPDLAAKYPNKSDDGSACEKSKLAIAVARLNPAAFPKLLDWLYENRKASSEDAFAAAAGLVGKEPLKQALANPEINQRLAGDMALAKELQVTAVPAIFVKDGQVTGGLDPNSFFKLLQKQTEEQE